MVIGIIVGDTIKIEPINVILWDQKPTSMAGKDALLHIAKVCFSRKGRKIFVFFNIRWKVVYSKVFPVLTALLFDF